MYPVKEGADIAYDPEKSWSIDDVKWRARGGRITGSRAGLEIVQNGGPPRADFLRLVPYSSLRAEAFTPTVSDGHT